MLGAVARLLDPACVDQRRDAGGLRGAVVTGFYGADRRVVRIDRVREAAMRLETGGEVEVYERVAGLARAIHRVARAQKH